jgi:hypothetical protein
MRNRQIGPDHSTQVLADIVANLSYKDGWSFKLSEVDRGQGCQGLTLMISAEVRDSCGPGMVGFLHLMPVPPAAYNRQAWLGWVLDQILLVEKHEALEFFRVNGEQAFFPSHAPGDDPYAVMQVRTRDEAHAPAKPWTGGACSDPHFREVAA